MLPPWLTHRLERVLRTEHPPCTSIRAWSAPAAPLHVLGSAAAHRQCYADVDAFQSSSTKPASVSRIDSLPLLVRLPRALRKSKAAHSACHVCCLQRSHSRVHRQHTMSDFLLGRLLTRLAHRLPRRLEVQILGLLQHCPILQPDPCLTLRRILPFPQHNHPCAMAPPWWRSIAAVACAGSMLQFSSPRNQRCPCPLMQGAVEHGACSRQPVACIKARAV